MVCSWDKTVKKNKPTPRSVTSRLQILIFKPRPQRIVEHSRLSQAEVLFLQLHPLPSAGL